MCPSPATPLSLQRTLQSAAFVILSLIASVAAAGTLQEQLDQAVLEFEQGNYSSAYWQLENLELDFGQTSEFLNRSFQSKLLPLRAYAALQADRPTDALIYFRILLRDYTPRPGVRAFTLYHAAMAQSQTHALAAAAQTYRSFQHAFPGTNEAALALLQEAQLLAEIGESTAAAELLDTFYSSEAPQTLRMQARLRALQLAGELGQSERVQHILFETNWNLAAMPDIAVLSFAALDAGDLLLGRGLYNEATRAYRLTFPHKVLIEKQRARLNATEQAIARQSHFASSIWKQHSRQLVERLGRQLKRLESMADYTPGLYIRSGQAYLLGQRFREAILLFRIVATTPEFEPDARAQAHYRWILAQIESEKWSAARDTAHAFLTEHPAHELANSALFLVAQAHQGEGLYAEAIGVLDELITRFPGDKQAPRWYFTRGYNYCVLKQPTPARANFQTALTRFPQSTLAEKTELWNALTYFFERDYANSLSRLQTLKEKSQKHHLYPEICYRTANVQYAQRNYSSALETADALIKKFPEHYRYAAAHALRGDIYMGLGELPTAAHVFKQVPAEDAQIYDYSVFQAAKIYKALERYDLLRAHLKSYVSRKDAATRPRVSEALYWIGWSHQQENRTEEAFPIFEAALARFGNDPQARAVGAILSAYGQLYERHHKTDSPSARTFETWLHTAADQSLREGSLTWFARLTLFTSQRQRRTLDDATAEATLLSIHRFVPIVRQDPETLASVGLVLAQRGYDLADDYFEQLLTAYPKRFERATAYYGKARLAANAQRLEEARRWLVRFLEETPRHPLAPDARLLAADVLTTQGLHDQAADILNDILRIKEMRGRPHARALGGLARIESERGHPKRAIAYWQRIYTLYRAYPELIAIAYWESALLFEAIGDTTAARNTLEEMRRDARLKKNALYTKAETKLRQLERIGEQQAELASAMPHTEEAQP